MRIALAAFDFGLSTLQNLFVVWALTRVLSINDFGQLSFLIAISVLTIPIITMSLPNYILLDTTKLRQMKVSAARIYTITMAGILSLTLFVTFYNHYPLMLLVYSLHLLISSTDAVPRTIWKNTRAKSYVAINSLLNLCKLFFAVYFFYAYPTHFLSIIVSI